MAEESADKRSRVQHRLSCVDVRDRKLLKLLRRRRGRPSRLDRRLRTKRFRKLWIRGSLVAALTLFSLGGSVWAALFLDGKVTYRGVPYQVIRKFWQDEIAKTAYFSGDEQALHYRLSELGIERDIKAYYRAQPESDFENEYELDRHIHQIMFDRTGYVGEAYQVDRHGRLVPR